MSSALKVVNIYHLSVWQKYCITLCCWASLPTPTSRAMGVMAWNWPRWEYLYQVQMLRVRALVFQRAAASCLVAKWCLTLVSLPARLLCPRDFPGKNTRMGCHFLLQGNLPNLGVEPGSPALACGFFATESPGKPFSECWLLIFTSTPLKLAQLAPPSRKGPPCLQEAPPLLPGGFSSREWQWSRRMGVAEGLTVKGLDKDSS